MLNEIKSTKDLNNYAFIDSQNVYHNIRNQGWKIDWNRFRVYLAEHYGVTKAFIFIGFIKENESLYQKLKDAGFICIFKPTLIYKDGTLKGNVDAELVLQTMIEWPDFNKAVIVTGDGDFYCLIKYLSDKEKLRMVLVPNQRKYSALLKKFAKKNISFMNELKNKIGQLVRLP